MRPTCRREAISRKEEWGRFNVMWCTLNLNMPEVGTNIRDVRAKLAEVRVRNVLHGPSVSI